MSSLVFPDFPGLAWGTVRTPVWSSYVQKDSAQRRVAMSYVSYPLYQWKLNIAVLRQYASLTELSQLQGFFNIMAGQGDTFLFKDPDDNAFTAQTFAVANSAVSDYQLVRTYGGFVEPVFAPDSGLLVYDNGTLKTLGTHYTVGSTGIIHFLYTLTTGHTLSATGTFKWRSCFTQDTVDFEQDFLGIWKAGDLMMESVKQ